MRECKCGERFETLTQYRLHQRDDCRFSEEEPVEGDDIDAIAERATEEILVCDVCGQSNSALEQITKDHTNAGLAITGTFQCEVCGATNENTAILE